MSHRYWRINIYGLTSGTVTSIAEVELRSSEGGADITGSGTASANNETWGAASNAFDNDSGTFWAPNDVSGWLSYDFGVGNAYDIIELAITARNDSFYGQTPRHFDLQYSDDNTNWTTLYKFRGEAFTIGQQRLFNASNNIYKLDNHPGACRYCKIIVDRNSGNISTTASEIELRESSGGADVTGSGTASADSQYSSTYSASKAFDDDTGTFWSSEATVTPHWIKYDFGAGNEKSIEEITFKIRTDSNFDVQEPVDLRVLVSNDDSTWYTIIGEYDLTNWSLGEQRVFTYTGGTTLGSTTLSPTTISTTSAPTTIAPTTYPDVVQLTSPLDLSSELSIPVTLTWESFPGASLYQVQVSTTNVFDPGDIVIDDTTALTTYNADIPDITYNTTYYWRVRALV